MIQTKSQKYRIVRLLIVTGCLFYFVLHLLTLQTHPFVHSDEAWLASLTRAMLQNGSLSAVEESFRLTDRYPHTLKTLYHLIQMPFIAVSWSAYAARIPSLLFGCLSIFMMLKLAGALGLKKPIVYFPALFMAFDPQFWYLSHLGRQEMLLIFLFLWCWYLKAKNRPGWMVALPLVAGIFIHPNAFILAAGIGIVYAPGLFRSPKKHTASFWNADDGPFVLLTYGLTLLVGAGLAIGGSYLMDSQFLYHYMSFGDSVGVSDSLIVKFLGLMIM